MNSTKDNNGDCPTGYVEIRREGDLVIIGSRVERITKSGEPVFQGVNGENTCRWVRELRGDPRYSSPPLTSAPKRKTLKGHYVLMPKANTYALGVEALRNTCRKSANAVHPQFTRDNGTAIYRPLTFRENLQARVDNFNRLHDKNGAERTLVDRLHPFGRWLDSCTGVAYRAGTSKMKIIPVCSNLIEINSGFREDYLPVDYGAIDGEELDKAKGEYNAYLTEAEVVEHPAWLAAIEDDKALLKEYAGIVFAQLKEKYQVNENMRFYVIDTTAEDELRTLSVNSLGNLSNTEGRDNLSSTGSFLLATPSDVQKRH